MDVLCVLHLQIRLLSATLLRTRPPFVDVFFLHFRERQVFLIFQPLLECHDVAVSFGENEKSKYPEENMIGSGEIWIMLNEHVTCFGT